MPSIQSILFSNRYIHYNRQKSNFLNLFWEVGVSPGLSGAEMNDRVTIPRVRSRPTCSSGRIVTVCLAVLTVSLSGCLDSSLAIRRNTLDDPNHLGKAAASVSKVGSDPDNPSRAKKPPVPQTVCQAISAYIQSFHDPLPPPKKLQDDQFERSKTLIQQGYDEGRRVINSNSSSRSNEPTPSDPTIRQVAATNDEIQEKVDPSSPDAKKETPRAGETEGGEAQSSSSESKSSTAREASGDQKAKSKDKEGGDGKEDASKTDKKIPENTDDDWNWYSAHSQATVVTSLHGNFPAKYSGQNSLSPDQEEATSMTATAFLACRLWRDDHNSGELIFNPEIAGGKGFSGVTGIAGFVNGEITRVGVPQPTPYIARLYYRNIIGFGGEQEKIRDDDNQIAGYQDYNRLTVTMGKFTFTDIIDGNFYSHDPRSQFLNWGIMFNGAWDFPANVRGYTYGVAIDYNTRWWALRYGIMAEPEVANGAPLDPHILNANGQALEWEGRYEINENPGHIRLMSFLNHADMGNYSQALLWSPVNPNIVDTRSYRYKYGCGLSWDQQIYGELGVFARLGWNDGHSESWAFTEIDRTFCIGLQFSGRQWRRPDDIVGIAGLINGISSEHRQYLAAGGYGFIIGDGALNYRPEQVLEIYYSSAIARGIFLTADFQGIENPAYNHDRGPVGVIQFRAHTEF